MHNDLTAVFFYLGYAFHFVQMLRIITVGIGKTDTAACRQAVYQRARGVDGDDTAVVNNGHPIGQRLRLLHKMGNQNHRLALFPNRFHLLPCSAARLWIQPRCQLIEENDLYFFTLRGKESSLAWGSAEECLAAAAASVDQPIEWL